MAKVVGALLENQVGDKCLLFLKLVDKCFCQVGKDTAELLQSTLRKKTPPST